MKGGLGHLMKQAQKLQEDFEQAQNDLASMEVVGESGAGMVSVTMTGRHDGALGTDRSGVDERRTGRCSKT